MGESAGRRGAASAGPSSSMRRPLAGLGGESRSVDGGSRSLGDESRSQPVGGEPRDRAGLSTLGHTGPSSARRPKVSRNRSAGAKPGVRAGGEGSPAASRASSLPRGSSCWPSPSPSPSRSCARSSGTGGAGGGWERRREGRLGAYPRRLKALSCLCLGGLLLRARRRMGDREPITSARSTSLSLASSRTMFQPTGMPIATVRQRKRADW